MRPFPSIRLLLALVALCSACARSADVVVYCALDQVFAEDLLREFEAQTGLSVRAEFDVEAHKTVGLVNRIRAESNRPRCDVFWNNEIAHTIALADEGRLAAYDSPSAADIPAPYRDPERRWTGFAARARVLIVNTELADPSEIHGLFDLALPRWSGQTAMARPRTGTTLTHAAALYLPPEAGGLGPEAARALLEGFKAAGVNFVESNGQVMRKVREGHFAFGLTDTDDVNVAREEGFPVAAVYPDQGEGELGTLLIPNSVAILADAPHPEAARRLVDFILSREVERRLAFARGAQIPVRPDVERPAHVQGPSDFRAMPVDYRALGRELPARQAELEELFVD
jgi:iron(III) transport system substrate-binding protein